MKQHDFLHILPTLRTVAAEKASCVTSTLVGCVMIENDRQNQTATAVVAVDAVARLRENMSSPLGGAAASEMPQWRSYFHPHTQEGMDHRIGRVKFFWRLMSAVCVYACSCFILHTNTWMVIYILVLQDWDDQVEERERGRECVCAEGETWKLWET